MSAEMNIIGGIDGKNKKILPLCYPPPLALYLHYIVQLSIIRAYDKTTDWFYSNYIQLYSDLKSPYKYLLEYYPDQEQTERDQFFLEINRLNDKVIPVKKKNIIDRIIAWIDSDYYVSVMLSESGIPGTWLYGKPFYPHFQFLFGYDREGGVLKLLNFDAEKKLSVIDVKFGDFESALFSEDTKRCYIKYGFWLVLKENKCPVRLYRFRNDAGVQYKLNPEPVIRLFEDYLYSKNTSARYRLLFPEYHPDDQGVWGIEVYRKLKEYLVYKKGARNYTLDIRPFFGIWEHKILMEERLDYFLEKGLISPGLEHKKKAEQISALANKLKLLSLKANYGFRPAINNAMIAVLDQIYEAEKGFVDEILNDLHR